MKMKKTAIAWTLVAAPMLAAAIGRRRHGGRTVFPVATVVWAPVWVLERSILVWVGIAAVFEDDLGERWEVGRALLDAALSSESLAIDDAAGTVTVEALDGVELEIRNVSSGTLTFVEGAGITLKKPQGILLHNDGLPAHLVGEGSIVYLTGGLV